MKKELLRVKIEDCFNGRSCRIDFEDDGWLTVFCGCWIFPDDIDRLRKVLYVSTIRASSGEISIYCRNKDVLS